MADGTPDRMPEYMPDRIAVYGRKFVRMYASQVECQNVCVLDPQKGCQKECAR